MSAGVSIHIKRNTKAKLLSCFLKDSMKLEREIYSANQLVCNCSKQAVVGELLAKDKSKNDTDCPEQDRNKQGSGIKSRREQLILFSPKHQLSLIL